MFAERSTKYTSFSSRKQPANAGTERKQFTENASVALQQPILTHAHTKCPPVPPGICQPLLLLLTVQAPICLFPLLRREGKEGHITGSIRPLPPSTGWSFVTRGFGDLPS